MERELANDAECTECHIPNETTKKAIKKAGVAKDRIEASSVEELFNALQE